MKRDIKVFFCAMFSVCLMQPWIYNLVLTSAEGGIKNSPTPATNRTRGGRPVHFWVSGSAEPTPNPDVKLGNKGRERHRIEDGAKVLLLHFQGC